MQSNKYTTIFRSILIAIVVIGLLLSLLPFGALQGLSGTGFFDVLFIIFAVFNPIILIFILIAILKKQEGTIAFALSVLFAMLVVVIAYSILTGLTLGDFLILIIFAIPQALYIVYYLMNRRS